jgi:hypothetical protein
MVGASPPAKDLARWADRLRRDGHDFEHIVGEWATSKPYVKQ